MAVDLWRILMIVVTITNGKANGMIMKNLTTCFLLIMMMVGCLEVDNYPTCLPMHIYDDSPIFQVADNDSMSRTFIDDDIKLLWNHHDQISVFYPGHFNRRYQFDGQTGETKGTFSAVGSAQKNENCNVYANYAIYPYDARTVVTDDGAVTLNLPSVQQYAPNSFGLGANTMIAVTKNIDDYFLPFKNVCGFIKIQLYGNIEVKKVILEGNNKERISGLATITAGYGEEPEVVMAETADSTITIECNPRVKLSDSKDSPTEFWFSVPPVDFKDGFRITLQGFDGSSYIQTYKQNEVKRNVVISMTPVQVSEYSRPAPNALWYKTINGRIVPFNFPSTYPTIISHSYVDEHAVVVFDQDIKNIPKSMFEYDFYKHYFTEIIFPEGLESIDDEAFFEAENLQKVVLPGTLTEIGKGTFSDCSLLSEINIPNSVRRIGEKLFYNCCNLERIELPDSIISIGSSAFYQCSKLNAINIPQGVTSIGSSAFYKCSSIRSIEIPNSVNYIGTDVFNGYQGEITINCNIPSYRYYNNAYRGTFDGAKLTKVVIGEGVTSIGSSAFEKQYSLTSMSIPSTVTYIGENAFKGCDGEVIIYGNRSDYSFYNNVIDASYFTKLTIGEGVTHIREWSASDIDIETLDLPSSIVEIGFAAFYGCSRLKHIYCRAQTPPTIDSGVLEYCHSDYTVYVPEASVQAYKSAWGMHKDRIIGF